VSFLLAFLGFCLLIVLHELGHFAAAKAVGMRVERFALFFPPLLGRVRRGETEYAIGSLPLGGYVKITGMSPREEIPEEHAHRAYFRQPVWKRVVVILAGPAVNVVVAFVIAFGLLWSEGTVEPGLGIAQVTEGSAADRAGFREGDRILSIEGRPVFEEGLSPQERADRQAAFRRTTAESEPPLTIVVARPDGSDRRTAELVPRYDEELRRPLVGITFSSVPRELGPGEAAGDAVAGMWRVTKLTVTSIVRLFYDSEARKEVSGVVGSYEATRQAVEIDAALALQILAIISLSLAIVNLFPFLPLDGGHVFWAVAEKVRGRRISFEVMERASVVGFVLVIVLFAIGLTNDLGRLTSGEGFGVR
jgi:regulator of sigma E protease